MVLSNGFCEMSQDEMMEIDGGGIWGIIGGIGAVIGGACMVYSGWGATAGTKMIYSGCATIAGGIVAIATN